MDINDYLAFRKAIQQYPYALADYLSTSNDVGKLKYRRLLTLKRIILRGERTYGESSGIEMQRGPGAEGFSLEGTGQPEVQTNSIFSSGQSEYRIHRGPRGGALPAEKFQIVNYREFY